MAEHALAGDDLDADFAPASRLVRIGRLLLVLLALGAAAWLVKGFLGKTDIRKPGVQQIALVKPPPPPPPPKPAEKPPEPPKVKEEVKLDEPKPSPKPDEPKPADDKPVSDKPLGVDADGTAGSDGFGLAASRGGRDLLSTGSGARGAYYSGLLQRQFFEALSRNRRLAKEDFRVVVRVWLGDDGHVQRCEIVTGSGNASVDEAILATLGEMSALKDVPPASMRPIQVRLGNRV